MKRYLHYDSAGPGHEFSFESCLDHDEIAAIAAGLFMRLDSDRQKALLGTLAMLSIRAATLNPRCMAGQIAAQPNAQKPAMPDHTWGDIPHGTPL